MECVQADNGFGFTNHFSSSQQQAGLSDIFMVADTILNIWHRLIRPYTPRHNGKAERSHRED